MNVTLSRPAQAVVITPGQTIEQAIVAERERRLALKAKRRPYHYWRERGDNEAPSEEHWCEYCAGFYGVPHDEYTHRIGKLCRSMGYMRGNRQCACIDCIVHEAWIASR